MRIDAGAATLIELRLAFRAEIGWTESPTPHRQTAVEEEHLTRRTNRDDFPSNVRRKIAARCGHLCSRPGCRRPTSGPHSEAGRSSSVGVAAHITGAAPNGPRFDAGLTPEQRSHIDNAIWLCGTCNTLVDQDENQYPSATLRSWRDAAEDEARRNLEEIRDSSRAISQTLKTAERHRDVVRKRDALRQVVPLVQSVYTLMNFASDEDFRERSREKARAIGEELGTVKPLFIAHDEVLQALHNLGQLAGLAVTPRLEMRHEFWAMWLEADKVLAAALRELETTAVE